ncbi:hypothetical protein [Xanthovirga aplysinae]|uniref:hypothetical protein n=1 Tax=Xanthovirga aplysinae TaxID=2529853 RepID=UPI0012BD01E8|nr:hypothetical protein [Xanthovirga aplysinae]MTI29702.1 hypothetical protein [Xanthovirga aplysinae]
MISFFPFLFIIFPTEFTSFYQDQQSIKTEKKTPQSIILSQEKIQSFQLTILYYPLAETEETNFGERLQEAKHIFPYCFMVSNQKGLTYVILFSQQTDENGKNHFYFLVNSVSTTPKEQIQIQFTGDITEHRALELIRKGNDPKAEIRKHSNQQQLFYFHKTYTIIPFLDIKKELVNTILTKLY